MNKQLETIQELIEKNLTLTTEEKESVMKALKDADKHLTIVEFKLDRTEKVKRTTAILLEETIEELEQKRKVVEETNTALQNSMDELKAAQTQLVHAEKMASLGELTAGIAHEIQNPLNFVNNFSEVSADLIEELNEELINGDTEEVSAIAKDLLQNLEKITHHGKRASFIVNGMLEHSRTSSGEKTPTDLNILAEEFLKLSYHGLRAKDKRFNAEIKTDFDKDLPLINLVSQDVGRVLLNLINNAFYAVDKKAKKGIEAYNPEVLITTKSLKNSIEISVKDNGDGIPDSIKEKIFQPFFTTKPTGEGTGLGLSLSYDIITKGHGGTLTVNTKEGEGTEFITQLPLNNSNI